MDILAGRKNTGVVTGEVLINGEPRTKAFKRLAGYGVYPSKRKRLTTSFFRYVMQDDVFMGTLTVYEYLRYIALLRLPAHMLYAQKMRRVCDNNAKVSPV